MVNLADPVVLDWLTVFGYVAFTIFIFWQVVTRSR